MSANSKPDILTALRLALPYIQKVAATQPTTPTRHQRQQQAVADVAYVSAAIAKIEARPEMAEPDSKGG